MALDQETLEKIRNLLAPLMRSEADRRAYLTCALIDAPILNIVDYTGATHIFIVNTVSRLAAYGKTASGENALWLLLETCKAYLGLDQQNQIDALKETILSIPEDPTNLPIFPDTQYELELDKMLRERLFVEGVHKNRDDVERWVAWYRARGKRPDLSRAKLAYVMLDRIDLANVDLRHADLSNANLRGATLHHAHLRWANLQEAYLREADLSRADLNKAPLQNADLSQANLEEASLSKTHLEGTKLQDANLKRAKRLDEASFNTDTTLPDGSKWSEDTNMGRFTDPNHPDFIDYS
ncbi:MAG: pentapeptide repeat-containing protein [Anaerolineae bacterium]|nr:pentapeptide repeat-containing protein [Anaerolineae bacterium]